MNNLRRLLLRGGISSTLLPLSGLGAALTPLRASAAPWNRNAFSARNTQEALKASGMPQPIESRDIVVIAPEIAENGAKVEIEVTSNIPGTRSIAVFADKNPMPLAASLEFSGPALPFARMQLKLAETTRLRAAIKAADGKTYFASKEVKITLGGCGG